MVWVASTLHTTLDHGVSSITTADAHTSAASSPLNLRPCRFKWTRPFRRKTKSGFCVCAISFQTQSNTYVVLNMGTAVAQRLRCCATNRKVAGSIPASVGGFFIDIRSFRTHNGHGVDSASNRNEYQGYFLGVKAADA